MQLLADHCWSSGGPISKELAWERPEKLECPMLPTSKAAGQCRLSQFATLHARQLTETIGFDFLRSRNAAAAGNTRRGIGTH